VEDDDDFADDDEDEVPAKKSGSKATERKEVRDLLAMGRDKGFLTYDEVNDALPADIVSSDQIDDVMSMFGDNDIAIVDEANKVKLPDTKPPEPEPVHAKAAEEEAEEKKEQEDDETFDEQGRADQVVKLIDKIRRLDRDNEKLREQLDSKTKKLSTNKQKELREEVLRNEQQLAETLAEIKLNKRQIERIIENLKKLIERVDDVEREIKNIERRAALPLRELRVLLRSGEEDNKVGLAARTQLKKLGFSDE